MKVETYEATVENGRIQLPDIVRLPEHTKVYVVVPGGIEATQSHIRSPRLVQRNQVVDFVKEIAEEPDDAGV